MSVALNLSFNQLQRLIAQCNVEEKIKLVRYLEVDTFEVRWKQLLKQFNKAPLSIEEITREVETVRKQRYEQKNTNRS